MKIIGRVKKLYTKQQYHIFYQLENSNWNSNCGLWSSRGFPDKSVNDPNIFGIVARGDNAVDLPTRLLCGNCFSVRTSTVRVSANAGRIFK